ncbi:DUF6356 family protein [Aestuariivirga sp.]|uniref:DUF6356 family protein n=1 Tax=Aestuariivirga sp. TaxID=2650926 RepID=UPI0039E31E7E
MASFKQIFHDHPAAVGESYFEHMAFALTFSARLFRAAFAAFAHGFVPAVCETTASQAVLDMHDEIRARRAALAHGIAAR